MGYTPTHQRDTTSQQRLTQNRVTVDNLSPERLLEEITLWLTTDSKPNRLHMGTSDLKGFVFVVDDHSDFSIVDALFSTHWVRFNVNQICMTYEPTGEYVIVRTQLPTHFEVVDNPEGEDDWGCSVAKPMVTALCKKNPKSPPHDTVEGELKRVCFDLRGSMIWLSDSAFRRDGKCYFPRRWSSIDSPQQIEDYNHRSKRQNSQATDTWEEA